MPNVNVYKQTGEAAGELALNDSVFGVEVNDSLLHQVVVAQLANKRQGTKSALTRAEVRGGGKKPWRQKKTGRARHGSSRSPIWSGGGVTFAPKPRDFSQKINKKANTLAILSALSAKVRDNEFIVLDDLKLNEVKTKEVFSVLKNLKLDDGTVLLVTNPNNTESNNSDIYVAARNIPTVTVSPSNMINVYDLIAHNKVLILKAAVKSIEEMYA